MDIQVRDITRDVWNTLIGQGVTPSVRKVYRRVGGKYPRVVEECRLLRQEMNGARERLTAKAEAVLETNGDASPEPKLYTCQRFPEMRIRHIHFQNGCYETSEPEEWALIEQNDWYLVFIFPG